MGSISENYSRNEFACNCGCGFDSVDVELIQLSEDVREFDGGDEKSPSSGCRCSDHNVAEGGTEDSFHLRGMAADFPCKNPVYVFMRLCAKHPGKFGFILYKDRVHVDSRSGAPYRWVVFD